MAIDAVVNLLMNFTQSYVRGANTVPNPQPKEMPSALFFI